MQPVASPTVAALQGEVHDHGGVHLLVHEPVEWVLNPLRTAFCVNHYACTASRGARPLCWSALVRCKSAACFVRKSPACHARSGAWLSGTFARLCEPVRCKAPACCFVHDTYTACLARRGIWPAGTLIVHEVVGRQKLCEQHAQLQETT